MTTFPTPPPPYPQTPPRPPVSVFVRLYTRGWRHWLVFLAGRYRERAARCHLCSRPFPWQSRAVTVVPLCPSCFEARKENPPPRI